MTIEARDIDGNIYRLGDQFEIDEKICYITYLFTDELMNIQSIRTITQNLDEVMEFTTSPENPLSRQIHLTGENKQGTFVSLRRDLDNGWNNQKKD